MQSGWGLPLPHFFYRSAYPSIFQYPPLILIRYLAAANRRRQSGVSRPCAVSAISTGWCRDRQPLSHRSAAPVHRGSGPPPQDNIHGTGFCAVNSLAACSKGDDPQNTLAPIGEIYGGCSLPKASSAFLGAARSTRIRLFAAAPPWHRRVGHLRLFYGISVQENFCTITFKISLSDFWRR